MVFLKKIKFVILHIFYLHLTIKESRKRVLYRLFHSLWKSGGESRFFNLKI